MKEKIKTPAPQSKLPLFVCSRISRLLFRHPTLVVKSRAAEWTPGAKYSTWMASRCEFRSLHRDKMKSDRATRAPFSPFSFLLSFLGSPLCPAAITSTSTSTSSRSLSAYSQSQPHSLTNSQSESQWHETLCQRTHWQMGSPFPSSPQLP